MSDYGSVTQCPKCNTSFHVGPAQLEAAKGRVRCGSCLSVFVAKDYFIVEQKPLFDIGADDNKSPQDIANSENLIEEETFFNPRADDDEDIFPSQSKQWTFSDASDTSNTTAQDPEEIEQPTEEVIPELSEEPQITSIEENTHKPFEEADIESEDESNKDQHISDLSPTTHEEEEEEEQTDLEEDWVTLIPERTGSLAKEPDISNHLPEDEEKEIEEERFAEALFLGDSVKKQRFQLNNRWSAVLLLLLFCLFLQSVYWQPASMQKLNIYNRVSDSICGYLPCRSVVLQDISQLRVAGIVRPSEQYNNALSVQIELRNLAQDYQYFPHIELAFTDLQGETISLRRFAPREYLRAETAGRTQMAPLQLVQIEFELYDPGASAISYTFNLLYLN